MEQFFTKDYTGEPFILFGTAHLVALTIVALVNILIIAFRNKFTASQKIKFRYTLAVILVLNETAWHLWNYFTGQWTIQTMLPLHLCSVLVWLSAYMLLTRNYYIYEFSYFLGIAGALQALLTPDAGIYGFPHFRFNQTMLSHGMIVTAAIFMTFVEGLRPTWKSVLRVILISNIYMAVIFALNLLIGSNYLFIAHKPATASLIDMLGPWPLYILWLEVIGIVLSLLLYAPYAILDLRAPRAIFSSNP
ncbi:MAG: TIGR02206 family membrane protein [Anaerolineales bacterium]|nr:TIGR02206 family membrane protein [Anaerolineales bacterium]